MMNEFLYQNEPARSRAGRPDAGPAWGLLSQNLTGYDWHGGFYAAPVAARRGPRATGGWSRRATRELAKLSARERRDARLPEPRRRPVARDALWQRVATWAMARVPGDPCPDGTC